MDMKMHDLCRRILSPRVFAVIVGIILLTAAVMKSCDIELFMRQIRDYRIITNDSLLILSAWGLIIVEFVLGASLLVYYRPRITVALTILLFCVFLSGVLWALITGVTDDCGCFGSWVKRSPAGAAIEDLFIMGVIFLSWPRNRRPEERRPRVKLFIVAGALIGGMLLPVILGSPIRELIGIGGNSSKEDKDLFTVELKDVDLKKGPFIFILITTDCSHCRESVEAFNRLAGKPDMPRLIALSADPEDQIESFIEDLKPVFPVMGISEDDFYRLLGMGSTPKSILVYKQRMLMTWEEVVPTAAAIRDAASFQQLN
jgi:hypothetical protein